MTTPRIAILASILALQAAPVLAADSRSSASPPGPYAETFAQLDVNRDGVLSFAESFPNPRLSNNFNALDMNADGVLNRDEVQGLVR